MSVQAKLDRLASGAPPRVLDLFAGCGGLSLGFHAAGFDIVGAVELDPDAAASHGANFHPNWPEHASSRDIRGQTPGMLCAELALGPVEEAVDVIVGGPPCQAYARIGRSKLREIQAHPEAFRHDDRAQLYLRYLDYVAAFKPLVLLMENVPDVLNQAGHNIAEEICEVLESRRFGYVAAYTLLNAAFYGVPQTRERMFLMAYRRELGVPLEFPRPTHWLQLPAGYEMNRRMALGTLAARSPGTRSLFPADGTGHHYAEPPVASRSLPAAVTSAMALADLPRIVGHTYVKARRGPKRFDAAMPYPTAMPVGVYARQMRAWPGFEAPADGVGDHVIRCTSRDWPIFARMAPNEEYPQAYAHAHGLLREKLETAAAAGEPIRKGSARYRELLALTVPPYDPGKFPNKWRKMADNEPARTLTAHLGKDCYTHIHYDSTQARTISVREAARLQSFPDGFVFRGAMNSAFRQIGNAVPPLMAKAVAQAMAESLARSATVSRGACAALTEVKRAAA